jgi:MFS transporter, SHS family, lactate transporter
MMPLPTHSRVHAFTASFLAWTLDAFDFFVLVFLIDSIAAQFGVPKSAVIWSLTGTLATRPLGALIFGLLADRYGRRGPLIAVVIFFSTTEVLCGFAPNYPCFLLLRILYGLGMGGVWGVGASLAMEAVPPRLRGILSGIFQSGYAIGYLLAAIATAFILPHWGWRAMFWIGGIPALLALYIYTKTPETDQWREQCPADFGTIVRDALHHWKRCIFLVSLMTLMALLSHGTQDLYPDFLMSDHHLSSRTVSSISILYNIGAVVGAIIFGQISQLIGRKYSLLAALLFSVYVIPFWAFSSSPLVLAAAAFVMQMGIQGAWGIIPVHLFELSPRIARALIPGLAYQLGILIAAPTGSIEYSLRVHFGYPWALASFAFSTICCLAMVVYFGQERLSDVASAKLIPSTSNSNARG